MGRRLLERDDEFVRLNDVVSAARREAGGVVLVEGPPGVGKSALLRALSDDAAEAGFEVLSARGDEREQEFAFGVVRQLFEPTVASLAPGERGEVLSGAASLAAPLVDPAAQPHGPGSVADPFPLLHGLYWLAANLTERAPLAIVVDDAHWADEPSLRWLHYLSRRMEGVPALVGLAARSTEPEAPVEEIEAIKADPRTELLRPPPLSAAASGLLMEELFATDPVPELVQEAHAVTGGNPFLLRELSRSLIADGFVPDRAAARRLRALTPDTVMHSALGRLARLPEDARALARVMALLGEDAQLRHAAALAGMDEAQALAAADQLAAAGFLDTAGVSGTAKNVRFTHSLIRQAVYADFSAGERAARHKDAARLLAAEPGTAERAAAHLLGTVPAGDPWVVDVLRQAAATATASGAPEIAATYLRRALAEPPTGDTRADVLLELGQAEAQAAQPEAVVHLEQAVRAAADVNQRAAALSVLAFTRFYHSDSVAAYSTAREALDHIPPGSGGEPEALLLAMTLWTARTVPEPVGQISGLLEQARTGSDGEPTHAELIRVTYHAYDDFLRGRRPQALQRLAWVMDQPPELLHAGEAPTGFALGIVQATMGLDAEAEHTLKIAFEHARRRGDKLMMGVLDMLAHLRWRRGDLQGAIADADTMLELYRHRSKEEQKQLTTWIRIMRALCLVDRGELEAAARDLTFPEELEARLPGTWWWVWLLYARGRRALAAGDWAQAREQALAAGAWLQRMQILSPHYMSWRSLAAAALGREGRRDEAVALAEEELRLAREEASPRAVGIALTTLGDLLTGGARLEALEEAVQVLDGQPDRLEHARALCELGASLRRANRRADAREPLRAAIELARLCGTTPLAERAHAELRATGARPRRMVFSGVEALTPRERQVAELAAEGRSNPEIAQALFVTRKTVETHLGAIYRKLEIDDREQLGDALCGGSRPAAI